MELRTDRNGKIIRKGDLMLVCGGIHRGSHGVVTGFTPKFVRLRFTFPPSRKDEEGRASDRFLERSRRTAPRSVPVALATALKDPESIAALAALLAEEVREDERGFGDCLRRVARRVALAAGRTSTGSD